VSDAERDRLTTDGAAWRRWGPYLSERAWGTVREDYSPGGTAWDSFPHEHARSRAYRWNEDGLGGLSDRDQHLCFAFAFWNGRDPLLKERVFGLTGPEGNHGEDAKEYWWYLDSTPTHSWMRWRYWYPQAEFPYARLVEENRRRGREQPEFELVDTGVFDQGWWDVVVDYAKASPDDLCIRVRARNAGPERATLHLLPTLWFRNRWSWGQEAARPGLRAAGTEIVADDVPDGIGRMTLAGSGAPVALACHNETNFARLFGVEGDPHPKDGINDHVLHGLPTVALDGAGTKGALWYRLDVAPGQEAEVRLRLAPGAGALGTAWEAALEEREREADAFYAGIAPNATADEHEVMRQAFAGMLWTKQFYHYDVATWLDGDPGQPPPPPERRAGRNAHWRHLSNHDVISMPDAWEYPWYAAWDLAFHCVTLAHVDPGFAKDQLLLMCREWYMHPNGQLPAYEWAFGDVNPPVHAWAALRVFEIDGARDHAFLARMFHKLLLNFTWWVNRKDSDDQNLFEGGFLGMDNVGPFDRSAPLPPTVRLEQSDGTGWMAMYCLDMLEMAVRLALHDPTYEDVAVKFFEHFTYIATAMNDQGLWDEEDGFFYDRLRRPSDGTEMRLKVRSMVGIVPMYAAVALEREAIPRFPVLSARVFDFLRHRPEFRGVVHVHPGGGDRRALLSVLDEDRLRRVLARLLDEGEFLSPHGLRSLSAVHRDQPYEIWMEGRKVGSVGYEPGESRTVMFGGNSNWRGPIWFPVNYLAIQSLLRMHAYYGEELTVEHPTGSGRQATLLEVARDLQARLVSIFTPGPDGRRPVHGGQPRFDRDPAWGDVVPFHEYFHGDTGAGLGASHQTGWTGLVADMVVRLSRARGGGRVEPFSARSPGA
jgi:hypothetical protein